MTYKEIVKKVSEELGLPNKFVDRTYMSYWRAVRGHIASLPLMEDLTEEEFLRLQPNVNIPSIGKFYVTPGRYKVVKSGYERLMNMKSEELNNLDKDATHNKD